MVSVTLERTPAPSKPLTADPRLRERLRVLLCCLGLGLLATATRPGRIIPDTKIDMALNPVGFLGRALHLWDIEQFGQLQNQAAGYLFPMGPFYALGHLAGMPAWIVQRLWLGTLLCVAFLGARRLAEVCGIGTPAARLIGAMAYALGPHALASLGTNSSEYLPLAMLPWTVVPLIGAANSGRIRAAARSALAVACCGGINGSATVAVLVVPALYLLTRRRVRLLACWLPAVAAAVAWWAVPLFLLGWYAYSWLTYTEKAGTTTSTTGLLNVFRGTERWVDSLVVNGNPWWPLGHAFATGTLPVLATGALAALGAAGLVRRGLPERPFLLFTLLAGVAVMVAGHAGPLAVDVRHLLDGSLAPFRNLFKFDGMVRLPLSLGIAHLLGPGRRVFGTSGTRKAIRRRWPAVAALVTLAGVAGPALSTGLSASGEFVAVPEYWRQAAAWLNSRAGDQGVMQVPGARFGEYTWGRPMDEITQPLLHVRWVDRQLVPAGSSGLTRLLDAIDERLTSGQGSPGLGQVLARIGVRYVLVRNDLQRADLRGAWPARVHEALDSSPGLRRVAWFGDFPAGTNWPDDAVNTIDQPYAPVEIYEVAGAGDVASLTAADQALRLYGSPEALLTMADNGLLNGRPVLFGDDEPQAGGRPFVADSLRRVQRNFGELRGQTSPTMTAREGPVRDITEPGWGRYETVATYSGIKDITASASASDATSITQFADPSALPYAALDGSPWTRWETGGWSGPVGQWLQVDFDHPLTPQGLTVMFAQDGSLGPPPDRISIETQAGQVVQRVLATSDAQPIGVAAGPTTWLRIRILGLTGKPLFPVAARVAIPELHIDGVGALRHYRLPASPAGATVVMARAPGRLPACMRGTVRWVCSSSLQRQDEEMFGFDRVFTAPSERATVSGTTTLTDPALIAKYTSTDPQLTVSASSVATQEPAGMPRSAFDDDTATTWVPAIGDPAPWLAVSWKRPTRIGAVTIRRPLGASAPLMVRVEGDNGRWREGLINADGVLTFKPMRTRHLTFRFMDGSPQVTDVVVPGVAPFRSPPGARVALPCGQGPKLQLNGVSVPTRASGTFADLLAGRAIPFQACHAVALKTGDNELAPVPFDAFRIESAVVNPAGAVAAASVPEPATVGRWAVGDRRIEVDAATDSYLIVNENFNAGWQARIGGRTLHPVRVDGWRQAWAVPAGTKGTVRLTYAPDRLYRTAVFGGLGLLLLLLVVAVRPARRRRAPAPSALPAPQVNLALPIHPALSRPRGGAVRRAAAGVAAVVVAAGLGYWVIGSWGAIVAGGVAAVFAWAPRRGSRCGLLMGFLMPWAVAVAMLAATVASLVGLRLRTEQRAGAELFTETLPQLLCLVVLAAVVVALCGAGPSDRPGPSGERPSPPDGGDEAADERPERS